MTSPQAMLNFIAVRDHRLMHQVNRWQPPRWIRLWMICATRGGDGWLWYAMGLIILLFGGGERFLAVGYGPQASLLDRAFLLGATAASGSILLSVGTHHHSLCSQPADDAFLSGPDGRIAVLRGQHCRFPRPAGTPLPQRCGGRGRDRHVAGFRVLRRIVRQTLVCQSYSFPRTSAAPDRILE
jgi:hypothetical protein